MQLVVLGQPLDRHELVAVRLGREDKAGADESAVEEHGAGAALALLARVLRAGEAEPLAEDVEQALPGPDVGLEALAVDRQLDSHCRQRSTARTVRAPAASCGGRRRVPRTSSIGLAAAATRSGKPSSSASGACDESSHRPCGPERGANLVVIAVDGQRQRDDRDHHRVARAHFHERLWPSRGRTTMATISSSAASRFRFGPVRNSGSGTLRVAANARELDDRVTDEQRWQRVSGGGSSAQVAADGAAIARSADQPTVREASASAAGAPRAAPPSPRCR